MINCKFPNIGCRKQTIRIYGVSARTQISLEFALSGDITVCGSLTQMPSDINREKCNTLTDDCGYGVGRHFAYQNVVRNPEPRFKAVKKNG